MEEETTRSDGGVIAMKTAILRIGQQQQPQRGRIGPPFQNVGNGGDRFLQFSYIFESMMGNMVSSNSSSRPLLNPH